MKPSELLSPEQLTICKMYYYDDGNTNITTHDPHKAYQAAKEAPTPSNARFEALAEWIWLSY